MSDNQFATVQYATMSGADRRERFKQLVETIPFEKRADKIRWVSETMMVAEQTVRVYLMNDAPRVPPPLALWVMDNELKKF